MSEEKIRLPSGQVLELKSMTGADWKDCIYHARKLSVEKGVNMAEVGYWERYAELATGYTKAKLESMPLEDYEYLINKLMNERTAGPKGPREDPEVRKK